VGIKKYLVTGGTGFIGSALVRRLLLEGHEVIILDNNSRGVAERLQDLKNDIEIIQGDMRDASIVQAACRGMDSICHLAYLNGTEFFYSKPEMVLEIAVKGIVNIIDGAIKEEVREFILASSSEVYQTPQVIPTDESVSLSVPDPLNPRYSYGGGKIISELMAINYGRKYFDRTIVFRPHNVYGPDMGWEHVIPQFALRMKELCEKNKERTIEFPIQGAGQETRAFIYIDDFVQGLMLVMEKGEHLGIYHIGTMDEIPIKDVAIGVGKYFGRDIVVVPGKLFSGSTLRRCPDISKITQLGFVPRIGLSKGLMKTVSWYDKNASLRSKKR
jgi:nucleoside-diphosphate-sugar epimerase